MFALPLVDAESADRLSRGLASRPLEGALLSISPGFPPNSIAAGVETRLLATAALSEETP